ncbi:MAG: 30S ribosomal protein S8 [Candidatus Margulisbacteria bacterium GWF2_35_9]|nr:ribosomal protein S8 [uncultured bacterium]OGI07004.1 MAG: 30S ribosomal protein S8 [Candidatus Margulisbacteria bacterium GWF2_35_9]
MSVSDPIADMICVIKNGYKVKKDSIEVPYSRMKMDISKILHEEGYLVNLEKVENDGKPIIKLLLKYDKYGKSVISEMKRNSTPGRRVYVAKKDIPKVKNGFGILILSTNKGVLTNLKARQNNVGGEILCAIW